jgi:hypothetical protein
MKSQRNTFLVILHSFCQNVRALPKEDAMDAAIYYLNPLGTALCGILILEI